MPSSFSLNIEGIMLSSGKIVLRFSYLGISLPLLIVLESLSILQGPEIMPFKASWAQHCVLLNFA